MIENKHHIFKDPDEPECVIPYHDHHCHEHDPHPEPRPYDRHDAHVHPPLHPEPPVYPPYDPEPFAPNPVPVAEGHPCHHHHHHHHPHPCHEHCDDHVHHAPPMPPHHHHHRPLHWEEDARYVTKHELNRVLHNLAEADIFRDLSIDGTTVSVGGISKGTKFNKLTFAQFVDKLLYPKSGQDGAFVTQGELKKLLAEVAFSGKYSDLEDIPTDFDFVYPAEDEDGKKLLNSEVTHNVGGFRVGDSLKGMTISTILEKLLCGSNNIWGAYEWRTQLYDFTSGDTTIDATQFCPKFVEELDAASRISASTYNAALTSGIYEIYAVCSVSDKSNPDTYMNNILIASADSAAGPRPQTTVPLLPDVSADLEWTYNKDTKQIELLNGSIATDMCLIMIKR